MSSQELSGDQSEAMCLVLSRILSGEPRTVLAGWAGTGKTTLVRVLVGELAAGGYHVLFAAPTGKAASRLSQVAGVPVSTIHSLLYRRVTEASDGRPLFGDPREKISEWSGKSVLVVDEASMLSRDVTRHLEESCQGSRTQILYVGDGGQLPPVKARPGVDLDRPDAVLTRIHRQALDNPILSAATDAREGRPLPQGRVGEEYERRRGSVLDAASWIASRSRDGGDAIVLTATNEVRRRVNAATRSLLGRSGVPVAAGDQLIVRLNNPVVGVMNGETVVVDEVGQPPEDNPLRELGMARITCRGVKYLVHLASVGADVQAFKSARSAASLLVSTASMLHVDYGFAVTVHSSQGSEWAEACFLIDGGTRYRVGKDPSARVEWRKLAYTAVTRAKRKLLVMDVA